MASASSLPDDCPICWEVLDPSIGDVRILPCCHNLHLTCLRNLVLSTRNNPANRVNVLCPMCRKEHSRILLEGLPKKTPAPVPLVRTGSMATQRQLDRTVSLVTQSQFKPMHLELIKGMSKGDDSDFTCATYWNDQILWLRKTPDFGMSASTFRETAIVLFRDVQANPTLQRYKLFFRDKTLQPRWCLIEHSYHHQLDQIVSTINQLAITCPDSVSICVFPRVPAGDFEEDMSLQCLNLAYEIKHTSLEGYISGITCIPNETLVAVNRDAKTVLCFSVSRNPRIRWTYGQLSDPDRVTFDKKTDSLFVSSVYSGAVHVLSKSGTLLKTLNIPGYDNWEILSICTSNRTDILILVSKDCIRQYQIRYQSNTREAAAPRVSSVSTIQ